VERKGDKGQLGRVVDFAPTTRYREKFKGGVLEGGPFYFQGDKKKKRVQGGGAHSFATNHKKSIDALIKTN